MLLVSEMAGAKLKRKVVVFTKPTMKRVSFPPPPPPSKRKPEQVRAVMEKHTMSEAMIQRALEVQAIAKAKRTKK
jgi:hypothetical protein